MYSQNVRVTVSRMILFIEKGHFIGQRILLVNCNACDCWSRFFSGDYQHCNANANENENRVLCSSLKRSCLQMAFCHAQNDAVFRLQCTFFGKNQQKLPIASSKQDIFSCNFRNTPIFSGIQHVVCLRSEHLASFAYHS
jgi:hypothetical protein